MAGRFDLGRMGAFSKLFGRTKRIEVYRDRIGEMGRIKRIVETSSYQSTIGAKLAELEQEYDRQLRKNPSDKIIGALEVIDRIKNYISSSLKQGQDALVELERIEDARRKAG